MNLEGRRSLIGARSAGFPDHPEVGDFDEALDAAGISEGGQRTPG